MLCDIIFEFKYSACITYTPGWNRWHIQWGMSIINGQGKKNFASHLDETNSKYKNITQCVLTILGSQEFYNLNFITIHYFKIRKMNLKMFYHLFLEVIYKIQLTTGLWNVRWRARFTHARSCASLSHVWFRNVNKHV